MSIKPIIIRNCNDFGDREFKLVDSFDDSPQKFKCIICERKGYKGYILKDHIGQIRVGKTCLNKYFSKSSGTEETPKIVVFGLKSMFLLKCVLDTYFRKKFSLEFIGADYSFN